MAEAKTGGGAAGLVLKVAAWARVTPRRERLVTLLAAALAFEGVALVVARPKIVLDNPAFTVAGVVFASFGVFLLLLPALERALTAGPAAPKKAATSARAPAGPALADRIIGKVTLDGKLDPWMPMFGIAVIAFDLAYNAYLTSSPRLLSNDFAVLGFGAALIAFRFFPARLTRERNFALLFFGALTLVFGVPLLALRLGHDASGSVDEYTATLVTPQLAWILNALGNQVFYSGNDVYYLDLSSGQPAAVHIATQCSGLYSMAIFIAAFSALVLTDYPRLTVRVAALLGAGIFLAYLANLLRMVVIVEAGHYYGSAALLSTHENLGDIIFLAWVAPFMWVAYRILDPREGEPGGDAQDAAMAASLRAALRARGEDPDAVGDDDWFCATCYARVEAPGGRGPTACPACGAAL